METYVLDWLTLLLRWAHVITGIAWIGASFHFVALDNSLTPPEDPEDRERGVGGERWAVHGGGFYHSQKYPVSPPRLPDRLHWSMWESYSTWVSGFLLFGVLYIYQAGTFLIDRSRFDWPPAQAAAAALGFLLAFWLLYDAACRLFGRRRHGDLVVALLVALLVVASTWLACRLFAGRAAFLLVGAMMATAMSANVLFWIIPGQRKVVAALRAGQAVDPLHGQRGKQRSLHNTYFTLPVLLAMISNHYGFLHEARANWLWLLLLMLGGALIRASFVMRHKAQANGRPVPWRYAVAGAALLGGVIWTLRPQVQALPAGQPPAAVVGSDEALAIVQQRCVMCHNATLANKGVALDSLGQLQHHAQQVYQQAVVLRSMPLNNATRMSDEERQRLRQWFESGAAAVRP